MSRGMLSSPRFAVLLVLMAGLLATSPLSAETPAAPSSLEIMLTSVEATGDCLAPSSTPADPTLPQADLGTPETVEASASGGFYACLNDDFLCGGCPSGTHCAWEACGSPFSCCITGNVACVSSCTFASCNAFCRSCF